jgi:ABC-type bacteriocin/lantibiotic exporter with double-glycine peptidase domain
LLHIFMKKKVSLIEFFVSGVTLAVFINILLHAYLLEVQGRYSNHLWLILFWCFPFYLRETIWVRRRGVARDR